MHSVLKRSIRIMLFVAVAMLLYASAALAETWYGTVSSSAKVYKTPSTSASYTKVSKGKKVEIDGINGTWAQVTNPANDERGFMQVRYLTLNARIPAYTSARGVLYLKASTSSKKVATLQKGTLLYIKSRSGNYFQVENQSKTVTGYVQMSIVTTLTPNLVFHLEDPEAEFDATPSVEDPTTIEVPEEYSDNLTRGQKIEYMLKIALSLKGRPYSSSANPPKSFDCSRYVRYCYQQIGITLPASAETQGYSTAYRHIENIDDLVRGDVVCFNTNAYDKDLSDHTGLYLGGGQFIHASSAGKQVIISTLSTGYYNGVFSWGFRVLE
ncbi:MAG: C40 family peptidase [Clostridia bacterium]|nr:C40 family peptidase [Clostridia bacterium]